jgi:hypothetical protein
VYVKLEYSAHVGGYTGEHEVRAPVGGCVSYYYTPHWYGREDTGPRYTHHLQYPYTVVNTDECPQSMPLFIHV